MKEYVLLSEVGNGNIKRTKLPTEELKERALDKLDAKIYFEKLELNKLVKDIEQNNNMIDKETLEICYESTYRNLQVLEYIYQKILL